MSRSQSYRGKIAELPARFRARLSTTGSLVTGVFRRLDSVAVFTGVTLAYLATYLVVMNEFTIDRSVGYSTLVVDEPFVRMFEPGPGPFQYEPIGVFDLWVGTWVFSPLNTALGLGLSVLVGLNLALSYLAVTQPRSCGITAGSGLVASVPALFAGSACCGPVIFLVLGIQASGLMLTAVQWLLPAGIALLLVTLVFVAGKVDPTAV
jgi:hypothetical protein